MNFWQEHVTFLTFLFKNFGACGAQDNTLFHDVSIQTFSLQLVILNIHRQTISNHKSRIIS